MMVQVCNASTRRPGQEKENKSRSRLGLRSKNLSQKPKGQKASRMAEDFSPQHGKSQAQWLASVPQHVDSGGGRIRREDRSCLRIKF